MRRAMRSVLHPVTRYASLPRAAWIEVLRDRFERRPRELAPDEVVRANIAWLCRAQDNSVTADGGVARHYSLLHGWSPSYPETTGYVIPTFLECGARYGRPDLEARAVRMLDWLVSIQLPGGGFQGGMVDQKPVVPVVFNTGQVLLGLAAGAARFESARYRVAMAAAADWLIQMQDEDGAWRRGASPFAMAGEKTYDTHTAWGLLEAARVAGRDDWAAAALANVDRALSLQRPNGWFASCCLTDASRPLTHTIGYAMRGLLEAHRHSGGERYLSAVRRAADALLEVQLPNRSLPGRLTERWEPAVSWSCLTGNVQIAAVWLELAELAGDGVYADAGVRANRFVHHTIRPTGNEGVAGGVKGSHPVYGAYGRFQYLNWAAKFCVDATLLQMDRERSGSVVRRSANAQLQRPERTA